MSNRRKSTFERIGQMRKNTKAGTRRRQQAAKMLLKIDPRGRGKK